MQFISEIPGNFCDLGKLFSGSTDSLKCYVINKVTNPTTGTLISDTKSIQTCHENSACLLTEADASVSVSGFDMNGNNCVHLEWAMCSKYNVVSS